MRLAEHLAEQRQAHREKHKSAPVGRAAPP
jgi:hypothetical protein